MTIAGTHYPYYNIFLITLLEENWDNVTALKGLSHIQVLHLSLIHSEAVIKIVIRIMTRDNMPLLSMHLLILVIN